MNEKYLITGATGFVGANIVRKLIAENKEVHVLTRNKKLNWRLADISSKIKIHEVDLQRPDLKKVISQIKPDYIFHLAAYGSLPKEGNINELMGINLKGTINLIEALKQNKFKLLIHTGSSSEYGISDKQMKETDALAPINDYGVMKAAATLYCQKEVLLSNLPIIVFRLFSPYGYFEEKSRLIPSVIIDSLGNKPIALSSPNNVRDFVFIDDVVEAYIKATEIINNPGEIFNIGTSKQHQISEVVNLILQITNSNSKIAWNKIKKQARQVEPRKWEADISKANKILKWYPKYDLRAGLKKTIEWLSNNRNPYA